MVIGEIRLTIWLMGDGAACWFIRIRQSLFINMLSKGVIMMSENRRYRVCG